MEERKLIRRNGEWELVEVINDEYPEPLPFKLRNTRVCCMKSFETVNDGLRALKDAKRISSKEYFRD